MNDSEKYITTDELMSYLKVARCSIQRYIARGLPSVKIGGFRRFKLSEVEAWIKKQNQPQK